MNMELTKRTHQTPSFTFIAGEKITLEAKKNLIIPKISFHLLPLQK